MQPRVGRGRGPLCWCPAGEGAPGRAAGPWRGWAQPDRRRGEAAPARRGGQQGRAPRLTWSSRNSPAAISEPGRGRGVEGRAPDRTAAGGTNPPTTTRAHPPLPASPRPVLQPPVPAGGWDNGAAHPGPPAGARSPFPPPGLYLGLRRVSLAEPAGV